MLKFDFFQTQSRSSSGNVISIDTPWKTVCSVESGMAALIIPDALIKKFGGSLGEANEKFQLSYTITIESEKNTSMKRKHTEQ